MSKFSLREALAAGTVSGMDTGRREQIEYIDLDRIQGDARNFYEISGVDELAASIELVGLQQPIRVRPAKEAGYYIIVSGHRRRAALAKLAEEGKAAFCQAPCIVERGQESEAWQELRLILANSDTRRMTNAEIAKQAENTYRLLYQLKEEGVEFPGRMRDHVAEACQISRSKLARLEVIGKGLISNLKPLWENGTLPESNAYRIARERDSVQMKLLARHGTDLYKWTEEQIDRAIDRVKQPEPERRTDALPARQAAEQYLQELEAENKRFLEAMRSYGYFLLSRYVAGTKDRRAGIEELKKGPGFSHRGGGDMAYDYQCMPQYFAIRIGDDPEIKRSWTEVYDALATVALERAEAAQTDRLPDADEPMCCETAAASVVGGWVDVTESYPEEDQLVLIMRRLEEEDGVPDYELEAAIYRRGKFVEFNCEYLDFDDVAKWAPLTGPFERPKATTADEWARWADAQNEDPVESGLYWVITGPLAGGGKLHWWNAEAHQWEHPAAKCSLTVNAKAWMPCPELPEGLRWNREES